jgi:hypothetical protein
MQKPAPPRCAGTFPTSSCRRSAFNRKRARSKILTSDRRWPVVEREPANLNTDRPEISDRSADVCEAAAFFISAAATRNMLRTTRSRSQIAAYAGFAALSELLGSATGGRKSVRAAAINASAAAAAVVMVKLATEGLPDRLAPLGRRRT